MNFRNALIEYIHKQTYAQILVQIKCLNADLGNLLWEVFYAARARIKTIIYKKRHLRTDNLKRKRLQKSGNIINPHRNEFKV